MSAQMNEFTSMFPGNLQERGRTCMRLVTSPEVRLLTLTGPPGVGKTWLMDRTTQALEGKLFTQVERLELAKLDNWLLLLPTLAETLGLASSEQTLWDIKESLLERLRDETMLLVLDAFENLLPAAASLGELLETCPGLKVIVTSRQPLGLANEHIFEVEPLAVPNLAEPSTWVQTSSVALFLEQAQGVVPGFRTGDDALKTIAQLCTRLDGLPLAILTAAQQLARSKPEALLDELSEPSYLKWWGLGDLGRSSTLHSALKWSYQTLSHNEQTLVKYASAFEDALDLAMLEKMIPPHSLPVDVSSSLNALTRKHLVRPALAEEGKRGVRLSYLIRDFARLELAESGEDVHIKSAYDALKPVGLISQPTTYTSRKVVTETSSTTSTSNDVDAQKQTKIEQATPELDTAHLNVFEDEAEILELVTEPLTEREIDVLKLVARGLSNREVASHLDISHRTVSTHLSNIYSKLNVHTRTAAARRARQLNLVADV